MKSWVWKMLQNFLHNIWKTKIWKNKQIQNIPVTLRTFLNQLKTFLGKLNTKEDSNSKWGYMRQFWTYDWKFNKIKFKEKLNFCLIFKSVICTLHFLYVEIIFEFDLGFLIRWNNSWICSRISYMLKQFLKFFLGFLLFIKKVIFLKVKIIFWILS